MALLTPNPISAWPTYPAFDFFAGHGGTVICMAALVLGSGWKFQRAAVWRSFGLLLAYAALVGLVDVLSGANFMFLLRKPRRRFALGSNGCVALAGLLLFWLLWLPVRLQETG
jgi:uncharacterized membrane protein YwaF